MCFHCTALVVPTQSGSEHLKHQLGAFGGVGIELGLLTSVCAVRADCRSRMQACTRYYLIWDASQAFMACSIPGRAQGHVVGLWAAWPGGMCPCPWLGAGTSWSVKVLPTQTIPCSKPLCCMIGHCERDGFGGDLDSSRSYQQAAFSFSGMNCCLPEVPQPGKE